MAEGLVKERAAAEDNAKRWAACGCVLSDTYEMLAQALRVQTSLSLITVFFEGVHPHLFEENDCVQ
eukprot:7484129-Alexandrium_andersonii.AAC.1